MRATALVLASLLLTSFAYGKDLKAYQDATLLEMDSVACGSQAKNLETTQNLDLPCQEYALQTDQVVYRVRPKDGRNAVLLPIGENVKFRLNKTKILLRVGGLDSKEYEFAVISVKPRGDNSADATAGRVNHLQ